MIYFPQKFKFQKESESLHTNLKDRNIMSGKKMIKKLRKQHQEIQNILQTKAQKFQQYKNKVVSQHTNLKKIEQQYDLKIIKLQVKRDRILSEENPKIIKRYAGLLEKYLHSYAQNAIYNLAASIENIKQYNLMRKVILRMEMKFLLKGPIQRIFFLAKCIFQGSKVIVIGKCHNFQKYQIKIFSIQKPSFQLIKIYNPLEEDIQLNSQFPLLNLVILKEQHKLYSLREYLEKNYAKINQAIKKLIFKVKLQKQRRMIQYYKVTKIKQFYQAVYGSIQQVQLEILITVKRIQGKKYITIETIKSYQPLYTLKIKEQLDPNQKFIFQQFFSQKIISLKRKKILSKINFKSFKMLTQLIRLQNFIKMKYILKNYKTNILKKDKDQYYHWIYQQDTKILISCIKSQQINQFKVFFQCLIVKNYILQLNYPNQYWKLVKKILWLPGSMGTVSQARDNLQLLMIQSINQYQAQKQRTLKLKPQKDKNRLHRFLMKIFIKSKKLNYSFGTYVLIIRKSYILTNVLDVNLYKLKSIINQRISQKIEISLSNLSLRIAQEFERVSNNKRNKKLQKTIHIFHDYLSNYEHAQEQFYIDQNHFLLKPPKKKGTHYIQRIASLNITSEQIKKELLILQAENPTPRKKKQGSRSSIFSNISLMKPNDQLRYQYHLENSAHQNILYYSLLKDKDGFFYLDIYLVFKQKYQDQELVHVYRQEILKKDLVYSNWTLIYSIVAKWVRDNCKNQSGTQMDFQKWGGWLNGMLKLCSNEQKDQVLGDYQNQ